MDHDGAAVSRAEFEANLIRKLTDTEFCEDIRLLIPGEIEYDPMTAADDVRNQLIARLPGQPWKGRG